MKSADKRLTLKILSKKFLIPTILLAAVLTAALFWVLNKKAPKKVCFDKECFEVEIARTPLEKRKGLQGRKTLPENKGMLFIFNKEEFHSFWMKETLIPLDIIWINSDLEVVDIKENALPCKSDFCPTFTSSKKAKYVLEINGSLVEKKGIRVGDKASFYFAP